MRIQKAQFVRLVDLLEGDYDLMEDFINTELNNVYSFWHAWRYFVSQREILCRLELFVDKCSEWKDEVEIVREKIENLPSNVWIDLAG